MQIQTQMVDYILSLINMKVGPLKQDSNIAVEIAPGGDEKNFLDGSKLANIKLLLLCKNKNQKIAYDYLCEKVRLLNRMRLFESNFLYKINSIDIDSPPSFVTKENGEWIYSAILNLNYSDKEKKQWEI